MSRNKNEKILLTESACIFGILDKIAFTTGILFENDVDMQVAEVLASHVVTAPVFSMIREEEEKAGFSVLDGMTLVPHLPEFFSDKFLHPNDLGFGIYAENGEAHPRSPPW